MLPCGLLARAEQIYFQYITIARKYPIRTKFLSHFILEMDGIQTFLAQRKQG
jgi:hypothetical protein